MLAADVVKDYSLTVMLPGVMQEKELRDTLNPMVVRGYQDILAEGVQEPEIIVDQYLDMRYQGQSFELTIPFSEDFLASFHNAHKDAYGFHDPKQKVEIVNIRVRAVGKPGQLPIKQYPISGSDPLRAMIGYRQLHFPFGSVNAPLFDASLLLPGNRIPGPARIVRADTTIVAGPGDNIEIDSFLNLVITLD
jgi:N-methylhydantoinase A